MSEGIPSREEEVRAAEVIAALSLATDLSIGVPLEHGLHSTLVAVRLCERLGVDSASAWQAYYGSLLFYVGCTAPADIGLEIFGEDDALTTYGTPARFGSRPEMAAGMLRAVAPPATDARPAGGPGAPEAGSGVHECRRGDLRGGTVAQQPIGAPG